jgi:hypothetical protein
MTSYLVRFYIGETSNDRLVIGTDGPTAGVSHVTRAYGGATALQAKGSWIAPNGQTITEGSWIIEAIIDDDLLGQVPETARLLKATYEQDAVLYTVQALVTSVFV